MKTKRDCRGLNGQHIRKGLRGMGNSLKSSEEMRHDDNCRGIHGAARARRGVKHASVTLSRRLGKEDIRRHEE